MPPRPATPFAVGDRITLKKPHPCGGRDWDVYRIGADIGLRCLECGHRVMLRRSEVERRMVARAAVATTGVLRQPRSAVRGQDGDGGRQGV